MKTKRILIDLPLDYGMNHMGFESNLTRQEISINSPKLQKLTIREFCMLPREEVLSADSMTADKLSAIERLLDEYSLRLGMSAKELDTYLNCYYQERPEEKKFYDLCDQLASKPSFDEKKFRDELKRELHGSPTSEIRFNDLGWQRYLTVREAYLNQPWYVKCFCSRLTRMRRATKDALAIHEIFCLLATESCIDTERWNFEHKEVKATHQR